MIGLRVFAGCLAIVAIGGCARHTPENTANAQAGAAAAPAASAIYPAGIVAPANWASATHAGIYSSDAAKTCCFLAGNATLALDNPAGAQLAVFTFYTPAVAPLRERRERVSVSFNGTPAATASLAPGMQNVSVPIPPSLRQARPLHATLRMSVTWVPKKIGLNEDRRELSVMLVRVGYI
ncbi:MAG: hypothetical protein JOY69_09365 [Candidatus Eremiobacteraeota bacterium]|nr:hypothetical protein [Candidatus Eremiobacteraeota bacterium]MBV8373456.1 hypothetical protein [Candidatus Eremiobacteraeota bacterium]